MTRPLIPFWLLDVQIRSRREDSSGAQTLAEEGLSSPLPEGFILTMIQSQRVSGDLGGRQSD